MSLHESRLSSLRDKIESQAEEVVVEKTESKEPEASKEKKGRDYKKKSKK